MEMKKEGERHNGDTEGMAKDVSRKIGRSCARVYVCVCVERDAFLFAFITSSCTLLNSKL